MCVGAGRVDFTYDQTVCETSADAIDVFELLLEQAARWKLEPNPTAQGIAEAREAVDTIAHAVSISGITAELAAIPVVVPSLLDVPPLRFDYDSRPLAAGGIPNFSREGYVSFLMRACDPLDPLDIVEGDTMRRVTERARVMYRARILAKVFTDPEIGERLKRRW